MLNELYVMQRGLEKIGKLAPVKHNDIKSPGMGTTFRVVLKSDGSVSQVELMDKEKIKNTWSIGNGNKNQFPAIKLTFPLLREAHEEYLRWKKSNKSTKEEAYREFINRQINQYELNFSETASWPSYRTSVIEKTEQLERNYKDENFFQIFERYRNSENDGIAILRQTFEILKNNIDGLDSKSLSAVCDVLFGTELGKNGQVKDGKRVTFILDALPSDEIDHYASSRREVSALSKALFAIEGGRGDEAKSVICALSGIEGSVVDIVFPEEKLAVVGATKLYAKNSGTSGATVKRYGHSGAESYFLSKELSTKLAATIALLSSDNNKGITWSKAPSSAGSSPSLLLAYCKEDLGLSVSKLITGSSEIEDFEDYQDATKTVLDLFHNSNCTPDAAVEIAEVIVLDKANRKINYTKSSKIEDLEKAANEWVNACKNTPLFKLYAQIGKEKKMFSPWPIAPIKIGYLSRQKYIRGGESSTSVPAASFSDVMGLFFSVGVDSAELASRTLNKLSNQFEPLIELCALSKEHSILGKNDARVKTNPKNNTQALNAATIMGVLLYKLGRRKEVYMNNFAYQLG